MLHLVVTPGHAGETFEAVALVNGKEYIFATVKAPSDGGIPAGKTVVVEGEATLDPEDALPVIDLSADGTANTYYVNAANTFYRFRADVKGNGKALTCGGLSYTEEDLRIEPKAALVLWYSCLQTSYLPWIQASPVVLSSVKFKKDGYIYFDTPETFVNGNVVIVAIDKELGYDQIEADADKRITNAEVLWSWNIVFSEGYDPDAAENWIVKGGYTWMNRDLGALIDPEQAYIGGQLNNVALASTTGNCYQWGRKDPFVGATGNVQNKLRYYSTDWSDPTNPPMLSASTTADGERYTTRKAVDEGVLIKNPQKWHNPRRKENLGEGYPYLSDNEIYRNLWQGRIEVQPGSPSLKTVYDPCPVGYQVPHYSAVSGFTTTGDNTNTPFEWYDVRVENIADYNPTTGTCGENGIYSKGLYEFYINPDKLQSIIFPETGYRDWDDNSNAYQVNIDDPIGYIWTAGNKNGDGSSGDDNNSYNFEFARLCWEQLYPSEKLFLSLRRNADTPLHL